MLGTELLLPLSGIFVAPESADSTCSLVGIPIRDVAQIKITSSLSSYNKTNNHKTSSTIQFSILEAL